MVVTPQPLSLQSQQPHCSDHLSPLPTPAGSAPQQLHATLGFCRSCFLGSFCLCRFWLLVLTQTSAEASLPLFLKQQPLPVTPASGSIVLIGSDSAPPPQKYLPVSLLLIISFHPAFKAHEEGALFFCSVVALSTVPCTLEVGPDWVMDE